MVWVYFNNPREKKNQLTNTSQQNLHFSYFLYTERMQEADSI